MGEDWMPVAYYEIVPRVRRHAFDDERDYILEILNGLPRNTGYSHYTEETGSASGDGNGSSSNGIHDDMHTNDTSSLDISSHTSEGPLNTDNNNATPRYNIWVTKNGSRADDDGWMSDSGEFDEDTDLGAEENVLAQVAEESAAVAESVEVAIHGFRNLLFHTESG